MQFFFGLPGLQKSSTRKRQYRPSRNQSDVSSQKATVAPTLSKGRGAESPLHSAADQNDQKKVVQLTCESSKRFGVSGDPRSSQQPHPWLNVDDRNHTSSNGQYHVNTLFESSLESESFHLSTKPRFSTSFSQQPHLSETHIVNQDPACSRAPFGAPFIDNECNAACSSASQQQSLPLILITPKSRSTIWRLALIGEYDGFDPEFYGRIRSPQQVAPPPGAGRQRLEGVRCDRSHIHELESGTTDMQARVLDEDEGPKGEHEKKIKRCARRLSGSSCRSTSIRVENSGGDVENDLFSGYDGLIERDVSKSSSLTA